MSADPDANQAVAPPPPIEMTGSGGAQAGLLCPACGEPTSVGARFCEACGAEVEPAPGAGADGAAGTAVIGPPGAATGDHVGDCVDCGAPASEIDADRYCMRCGHKQPAERDHLERVERSVAAVTDRGVRHHRNEDAFSFVVGDDLAVLIVCDGVSSTDNPDIASQAAADAAAAHLRAALHPAPLPPAPLPP
ncbi:MAG: zinc ribbon domain-containing protein, partial [Acidimicrobiia bacterium]|nr:zinc ribbon domain-containing protein [Acidimicrobiia bacterium]